MSDLPGLFAQRGGVVNLVCEGETSFHGFATAIVAGLRSRGVNLKVERILPIGTGDFPTKARRPANSRLDPGRLHAAFAITMPSWNDALDIELDEFVRIEGPCNQIAAELYAIT